MSNFRLNLPVDIPWKLIDSSHDMMDDTFCNKKSPSPFKSSLAIYAYEPKAEELPEEFCGDRITYLKVSCTITGYQPTQQEKEQIVYLLERTEVDYSKIQEITGEYFGCYGVLLNVSVHPYDDSLKDQLHKYPRIVDFEPKTRDFYQAASETGEVLTSSIGKVSTNKSFGTTDSTQNSWNAGATIRDPEQQAGVAGVGEASQGSMGEFRADTGQVRTETDQANWSMQTDASRERRELQSTTTQLSQMYNLLTGYHTGSNRAAFVMLPRPHLLQPTDRRTFVQGLRTIEGVQDFFLVVIRPAGQDKLKFDAHLQTGHFPENIDIDTPTDAAKYDVLDFIVPILDGVTGAGEQTIWGDGYVVKHMSKTRDVVDEANGWEADPTKGDLGHGGVKEIRNESTATIKEIDSEAGQVLSTRQVTVDDEKGKIDDVEYGISDGQLNVTATLSASRKNLIQSYGTTTFSRLYKVFLRRLKINAPIPVAELAGLLITQRSLCVEIAFGDCITRILPQGSRPDIATTVVDEPGFTLAGAYATPIIVKGIKGAYGTLPDGTNTRADFPFKKAIIRKIEQAMLTSGTSPFRYTPGEVGYLQTKHFQRQLLKVLPEKILDKPVQDLDFVDQHIRTNVKLSLREFLGNVNSQAAAKTNLSPTELNALKTTLFKS